MMNAPTPTSRESLAQSLGVSRTLERWLLQQGHVELDAARRFLTPKLAELTLPDAMIGRAEAARRLAQAIRAGEHIVVFGDYDCDGITATAILTEAVRSLGGRVSPLLANRFAGGYGVSNEALAKIRALQPKVLVTCDCGSSDHDSLAQVASWGGVDTIVIDHHLVPERPLPALAFLNPHRPECGFPYKGLASCGLVLSIVAALRRELNVALDVRRWVDLVAIGTIADVAPLDGDNRALVRAGLAAMAQTERPGLSALLDQLGISRDGPLTARDVAFRVAPQINAPGRLGAPTLALELLLATDEVSAKALAQELSQVTSQRKEQQEAILEEAVQEIEAHAYQAEPAIVVGRPGWNPGVVGIVAGRLVERYGRPVVVIGFEAGTGRGSVRGPRGSRLHDALSGSAESLVRFGGHQAAAGLELELDRLPEFRAAFCRSIASLPQVTEVATARVPLELLQGDTPSQLMADLDRLEPCGPDNPRPQLAIGGLVVESREVGAGHLKLRLDVSGSRLDCFGVNLGHKARSLNGRVRAVGDLRRNSFRGQTTIELFVEELSEDSAAGGAA